MASNGLKKGRFHLFVHHKWLRRFWKNTFFHPFFWSQNNPFSRHFLPLGGGQNGFQWAPLTLTMTSDQRSLKAGKKRDLSKCPGFLIMRKEAEKITRKPRKPVAIVRRRGGGGTVPQVACHVCIHGREERVLRASHVIDWPPS